MASSLAAFKVVFVLIMFYQFCECDPVLTFQPFPQKSTLIWFDWRIPSTTRHWTDKLENFLQPYSENDEGDEINRMNCDWNGPRNGKVCRFDTSINNFGVCTKENNFGYSKATPCIFLQLSNVDNWKPQFYNNSNFSDDMPRDLHQAIESLHDNDQWKKMIWISCDGEFPVDRENIGPINYYPQRGFQGYFYPALNQKGYMAPLVAIHFEEVKKNVIINIVCKIWAPNVKDNSARFQLMID